MYIYTYIQTCAYICSVSNTVAVVVNKGVIIILAKAISISFGLEETDYILTCIFRSLCVCVCVCVSLYIHMYIYIYICIYVYTHTHTHRHTHTHTHTHSVSNILALLLLTNS
jgi:hypothetical protein